MIAHGRARAATASVAEQRDTFARRQITNSALRREHTELHEMISTSAGAELRPGFVLVLARDRTVSRAPLRCSRRYAETEQVPWNSWLDQDCAETQKGLVSKTDGVAIANRYAARRIWIRDDNNFYIRRAPIRQVG